MWANEKNNNIVSKRRTIAHLVEKIEEEQSKENDDLYGSNIEIDDLVGLLKSYIAQEDGEETRINKKRENRMWDLWYYYFSYSWFWVS